MIKKCQTRIRKSENSKAGEGGVKWDSGFHTPDGRGLSTVQKRARDHISRLGHPEANQKAKGNPSHLEGKRFKRPYQDRFARVVVHALVLHRPCFDSARHLSVNPGQPRRFCLAVKGSGPSFVRHGHVGPEHCSQNAVRPAFA